MSAVCVHQIKNVPMHVQSGSLGTKEVITGSEVSSSRSFMGYVTDLSSWKKTLNVVTIGKPLTH